MELMCCVPNLRQKHIPCKNVGLEQARTLLCSFTYAVESLRQNARAPRTRQLLLALRVRGQPGIRVHVPLQGLLMRAGRAGLAVAAGRRRRPCL